MWAFDPKRASLPARLKCSLTQKLLPRIGLAAPSRVTISGCPQTVRRSIGRRRPFCGLRPARFSAAISASAPSFDAPQFREVMSLPLRTNAAMPKRARISRRNEASGQPEKTFLSQTLSVAVLAVCSEPLSVGWNSLITGKIEGISPILGPARMLGPLQTN